MGKGKILFTGVVVFASVMAISLSTQASGGNCQAKLVGKSYSCNDNEQDSGPHSFTSSFETGGISDDFDLFYGGADYGCSCNTLGSVEVPDYDSSGDEFECIDTNNGFLINGKIKGKKITGQGTSQFGDSLIFSCKEM
jgi:hypothetical protein